MSPAPRLRHAGLGLIQVLALAAAGNELGHAFGLPDATHDDGTPMSGAFYNYPNTHFTAAQKQQILSGPYGSFVH